MSCPVSQVLLENNKVIILDGDLCINITSSRAGHNEESCHESQVTDNPDIKKYEKLFITLGKTFLRGVGIRGHYDTLDFSSVKWTNSSRKAKKNVSR